MLVSSGPSGRQGEDPGLFLTPRLSSCDFHHPFPFSLSLPFMGSPVAGSHKLRMEWMVGVGWPSRPPLPAPPPSPWQLPLEGDNGAVSRKGQGQKEAGLVQARACPEPTRVLAL